MLRSATPPTTAPAITPPDTLEEVLEPEGVELEGVELALAVGLADAGTLDESRMLSAPKYSN